MQSSKRLEVLLKMAQNPAADSFAWYALAMEYKGLGRLVEPRAGDLVRQVSLAGNHVPLEVVRVFVSASVPLALHQPGHRVAQLFRHRERTALLDHRRRRVPRAFDTVGLGGACEVE